MRTFIDGGKYKVSEVLYADSDYEACLCSDVTVNGGETVIVNVYKSRERIRALLPLFYEMRRNKPRGFCGLTVSGGYVFVIFRRNSGTAFREYFRKNTRREYGECLTLAETLLCAALELDLIDDRIAAGVLSEKNAVVDEAAKRIAFNRVIFPDAPTESGFRGKRLGKMLRTIFPPDRYLPLEIDRLIEEMTEGKYSGCAAAYAKWREIRGNAAETRAEYEKEGLRGYLKRRLKIKAGKRNAPDGGFGGREAD